MPTTDSTLSLSETSIIRVAAKSVPKSVAGSIAHRVREQGSAIIQAVGMGAVNQAVKSIIVAAAYLAEEGVEIVMAPGFAMVEIDGMERTAIQFKIEVRP